MPADMANQFCPRYTPKNGQSASSFLDKLRPRCCRKEKGQTEKLTFTSGAAIPIPPPPPPPPPPPSPSSPSPADTSFHKASETEDHQNHKSKSYNGPSPGHLSELPQNKHMSGHFSYRNPVDVSFHRGDAGPGYIRFHGGNTIASFNSYDAHIPLSELIAANQSQQFAILSALHASRDNQRPRIMHNYMLGHVEAPTDIPMLLPPPPPTQPPATVIAEIPEDHNEDDQRSEYHKSGVAHSQHADQAEFLLRCVSCGTQKDPKCENVKRVPGLGGVPLCWRCMFHHIGAESGRAWFGV